AKQASLDANLAVKAVKETLHENYKVAHYFSDMMNVFIIELAVIIISSLAFPGWWKLPGIILTVIGSITFNTKLLKWSDNRSEELQSRFDLVCRLLLEKKNI